MSKKSLYLAFAKVSTVIIGLIMGGGVLYAIGLLLYGMFEPIVSDVGWFKFIGGILTIAFLLFMIFAAAGYLNGELDEKEERK